MKAIFFEKQKPVSYVRDDGKIYIMICVNGEEVEVQNEYESEPYTSWQCDFREIVTDEDNIDIDDVITSPESYLDWTEPEKISTEDQVAQNAADIEYLMMLSEANNE